MKILVTYKIPVASFSELGEEHTYTLPEATAFTKEEVIRMIPAYDALLPIFTYPIDRDIIDAGRNLKIISNFGVGYNNIDIKHAHARGITVCNTPKAVCFPTAEMAMGLILSTARRIAECDRRIRVEKESMWGTMCNLGYTLEGRTLGIIGMGNIGKMVARMAEAFHMKVIYFNRSSSVEGYEKVALDTLLQRADFISIHTPLTDETRKMIGQRELALMKPTAILVNTARGAVIDEVALADCLLHKRIAGAGLDVFEDEPHVNEVLYGLENVVLTPHNATGREAVANILHFLAGTPTNVIRG